MRNRGLWGGVACLLLICLIGAFPGLCFAEGDEHHGDDPGDRPDRDRLVKLRSSLVATPSPFDPQLGVESLPVAAAVRLTEELESLNDKHHEGDHDRHDGVRKYFLRLTWSLSSGSTRATRTLSIPIAPPFKLVSLPHEEGRWIALDGSLSWNGKADSGACYSDGSVAYVLKAEVVRQTSDERRTDQDVLGALAASGSATLKSTPPVIVVAQPANGAFLNATPVRVSGSVSGANPTLTLNGATVPLTAGAFSTSVALANDGPATLALVATDCAGRSSSQTIAIFLDRVAPVVNISVPNHNGATNNAKPTFTISVIDPAPASGADTSTMTAQLDGIDISSQLSRSATGATLTPAVALADGPHLLKITCADRAHNVGTSTQAVFVDGVKPLLTLSPRDGGATANAHPTIGATYVDPAPSSSLDLSSVTMTLDGQPITPTVGPVQATYVVPAGTVLQDGPHTATAQVTDQAQNIARASSTFLLDTTPPQLTIVSPVNGSTVTTATPVFQVSYRDAGVGVQPSSLHAVIDAVDRSSAFQATPTGASFAEPANQPLSAGAHSFQISVADALGNTATTTSVFTVTPAVTPPPPSAPPGYASGKVLDFNNRPLSGVTVEVVGQSKTATTTGDGSYSFHLPPGYHRLVFSSPGYAGRPERNVGVDSSLGSAIPPVVLMTADGRATPVTAAQGGVVQNSAGDIEVDIPPNALNQDATMTLTALPNEFSLPDNRHVPAIPGLSFAVQPEGLRLSSPATVKVANRTHLNPGHRLIMWAFDHDAGHWIFGGPAAVSADGSMIVGQTSHFSSFDFT